MSEDAEYITAITENIVVSAYPELLDIDANQHCLWGYCFRIENNSDEPITLTRKKLCLTDETGKSRYDDSEGFNGELPDLQPGEYFEYEETAQTDNISAVLYGYCSAITSKGEKLDIKLPILNLSSEHGFLLN